MILIYTPKVTNRIKFVFDFVFQQYFDIAYQFISTIPNDSINCLFYTNEKVLGFTVFQHNLLLEENITQQDLSIHFYEELSVLFFDVLNDANIPFDIFSAIFFLISRYEEYLPHQQDEYGRYLSTNSILNDEVFQFRPIVEEWLILFQSKLQLQFPNLQFKKHQFKTTITLDIDNAFAYKGRSFIDFTKLILKPNNIVEKYSVFKNIKQDPYYTFDEFLPLLKSTNHKVLFFFLLSNQHSNDSVVNPNHKLLELLIQNIAKDFEIGIHPSFDSLEYNTIAIEKNLLEKYTQQTIAKSRQHFLRIQFPTTFEAYIDAGLTEDYSLAYPNISGCRTGTTQPFYFFNLIKNEQRSLKLFPFVWMDASYQYYQNINNEKILENFNILLKKVKKIKGNLVVLFHNDLLQSKYIVYKNIFKYLINEED